MAADSQIPDVETESRPDQPEEGGAQRLRELWTQIPNLALLAGAFLLSNYDPDTMGRPQHH